MTTVYLSEDVDSSIHFLRLLTQASRRTFRYSALLRIPVETGQLVNMLGISPNLRYFAKRRITKYKGVSNAKLCLCLRFTNAFLCIINIVLTCEKRVLKMIREKWIMLGNASQSKIN